MRWSILRGEESRRHITRLGALLACCLFFAACTGSDDLDLGVDASDTSIDESSSAAAPDADEVAGQDDQEPDAESTDESASDESEAEDETAGSAEGFTSPVRFDNGEHESNEPIETALLEEKLTDASLSAYNNWRSCVTLGKECDYERDVAPTFSGLERVGRGQDHFAFVDGQKLIRGDLDSVVVTDVQILEATAPIVGQVSLCVVDSGIALIEAGDGREEEILDDSAFAYVLGHQVVSDADGVLTVEAEFNVVPITDDTSLCDEYS